MRPIAKQGAVALAITGLAAFGATALAQPAPPPAAAAPVDPARLALARRLMEVQYGQLNLPQVLRNIDVQVFDAVRLRTPNMDEAKAARMATAMEKVQEQMLPDMQDRMAEGLAGAMTTRELQAAVGFYESPEGRSFVQKMPAALGQAMAGLGVWIPRLREAVVEAACADNGCTPEQRREMMTSQGPGGGPPSRP